MTYRWHHCCQMTVTWIQLKPSDLPGHSRAICARRFLTSWGLLIWQEANFPLSTLIETQIASSSVPIKPLHTIPNFWCVPLPKFPMKLILVHVPQMTKWNANESQSWWCWGVGSHIIILQNKTTQRLYCLLFRYLPIQFLPSGVSS